MDVLLRDNTIRTRRSLSIQALRHAVAEAEAGARVHEVADDMHGAGGMAMDDAPEEEAVVRRDAATAAARAYEAQRVYIETMQPLMATKVAAEARKATEEAERATLEKASSERRTRDEERRAAFDARRAELELSTAEAKAKAQTNETDVSTAVRDKAVAEALSAKSDADAKSVLAAAARRDADAKIAAANATIADAAEADRKRKSDAIDRRTDRRIALEARVRDAVGGERPDVAIAALAEFYYDEAIEATQKAARDRAGGFWRKLRAADLHGGVYVLASDRYAYVGSAKDVAARVREHKAGGAKAAAWTRMHKLSTRQGLLTARLDNELLLDWETRETEAWMYRLGVDAVRGGQYTRTELKEAKREEARFHIVHRKDLCKRCGRDGHFATACMAVDYAPWTGLTGVAVCGQRFC